MGIKQITTDVTGLTGVIPNVIYIETNDTVATVSTAGYLNDIVAQQGHIFNNKQMALVYTTDAGCDWYQVTIAGVNASLVLNVSPGDVLLPVLANHLAVFTNVAGQIGDPAGTAIHGGSIQAGVAGTLGSFISYGAASGGALDFKTETYLTSGANFGLTITNVAMGQATTVTLPDPGNANGRYLVGATATPFTNNHMMVASGTGGLVADAGYQMKTVAAAVVAGGAAAQVVNDAFVTAASNIVACWNTSTNAVSIQKVTPGVGSFTVLSSGDPGASTLNYIVTKV